ncbi:MAG: preprotein translocase subunit SecA [Prevotellaceae bacterium]|jgi:preprotein translocase subunit SecA|nr:preprotein translocase subunit SecA [Prevotellaceae bacterium]
MSLNDILKKFFGNKAQRDLREIEPLVEQIKRVYETVTDLSNDSLRDKVQQLRQRINDYVSDDKRKIAELRDTIEMAEIDVREKIYDEIDKLEKDVTKKTDEILDAILPEAFALMKETAKRFKENVEVRVLATDFDRNLATKSDFVSIEGDTAIYKNEWMAGGNMITWDMVHYDVQLFGGVVLHKGKIAEMATGEGKTLVATLPVFLNALAGNGVHVVTVNDYLAKRDSEWMGTLYMFHGLSVDCIDRHRPNSEERRSAYAADITFGTNNEFGFDYLRDNMATSPLDLVQRPHSYAIVDEVDSVLIDDARTPLIISGPVAKGEDQLFETFRPQVERIVEKQRQLATQYLSEARRLLKSDKKEEQEAGALSLFRSYKGLPKNTALIKFLSEQGVRQQMLKTEEFYMQENNRNMPIAVEPLFFVIDEKNNTIELTDKGFDLLAESTNDPTFFVLPDVGGEVAELEKDTTLSPEDRQQKKDELLLNYSIKSERVHTINQLLKAYTLFEKDVEYVVIDNQVKIVDEQTGRIMEGRRYSDGLHQAIEAKERVKVEAATQTFATITLQNYFRMYHKLAGMTGTAETEAGELWDIYKLDVVVIPTNRPIVRNDQQDRIYRTKREKYNAVIQEVENLVNEGRAVLVGTTSVEISELLSRMLTGRKIAHNVLNAKLHQKEADIVAQAGHRGTVTIATNMAGRGTDIKLAPEVKAAGGLAIVGTERHESRRVDRQLRGRAGRQGDPGSSVFYVSLEDDLMRLFGSERISKLMDRMGFKEGEMLEAKMLSDSIERAQKKVEENHFGVRKRLLEYDDVMNSQREVIYTKRRHALMGERIGVDITNMIYDAAETLAENAKDNGDHEWLKDETLKIFAMETPIEQEDFINVRFKELSEKLAVAAIGNFKRKTDRMAEIANPTIRQVYEQRGQEFENILVPITDGRRVFNITANLAAAYNSGSKEVVKSFEKQILLYVIDDEWKEHLRQLDELRNSVQNASYEQKDPLLIYKLESFGLFKEMVNSINEKSLSILMRGQIHIQEPNQVRRGQAPVRSDYSRYRTQKDDMTAERERTQQVAGRDTREPQKVETYRRTEAKVGRNDLCPCGSGKKYKNCHGKGE